jgi:hypothetical protein
MEGLSPLLLRGGQEAWLPGPHLSSLLGSTNNQKEETTRPKVQSFYFICDISSSTAANGKVRWDGERQGPWLCEEVQGPIYHPPPTSSSHNLSPCVKSGGSCPGAAALVRQDSGVG